MLLVYVDDILVLSHDMKPIMDGISAQFHLKKDSLGPPKQYLGTTIKIHTNGEGSECWAMSSNEYKKAAAAEVVEDLDKQGLKLKGKTHRPYDSNYKPELDVTEELDDEGVAKFQGYIGTFHWMIELGHINTMTKVSQFSSFQAMPRRGHLEACYSILVFLRKHPTMSMVFHHSWIKI